MKNKQTEKKQKQKQTNTKQTKTINIIQRIKETIDGQQIYNQNNKLTTNIEQEQKQALMCSVPSLCYLDMSFILCKQIKSFGFTIKTTSQHI